MHRLSLLLMRSILPFETLSRFWGYKWTCRLIVCTLLAICFVSLPRTAVAQSGRLELTITDSATGEQTPARVEVQGADGEYHIAEDALLVGGDCDLSDEGAGLTDLESTLEHFSRQIENPYTSSTQFYTRGESGISLPADTATVRIFKGPEYEVYEAEVDIRAGETTRHNAELTRWVNMPSTGWYSGDGHLHIPRPVKELNPYISKMMQAEDIHVGNLLQAGKVVNFEAAPQHAHGSESYYREGDYILAAGQENPRSHFVGHAITLGADTALHFPEKYLIYRLVWEEAVKQGAANGYAHGNFPEGTFLAPHKGLAVMLPHDLMHFIEVLQFNRSGYDIWYDILNLGFRVTPTAGTDFPCGEGIIPGHERFYTNVEKRFTYENWLEAVKNGETFVTTGPMLSFSVNGQDIGSEIQVDEPSQVQIEGTILFDPDQDDVNIIEVIQNGKVIHEIFPAEEKGKIELSISRSVEKSSWFALRGYGDKVSEDLPVDPWHFGTFKPTSTVHSAPIYVTVAGSPDIAETATSKQIAKAWLARLKGMEKVLTEDNIEYLTRHMNYNMHAVPQDILIKNRSALLKEIQTAKDFFEKRLR